MTINPLKAFAGNDFITFIGPLAKKLPNTSSPHIFIDGGNKLRPKKTDLECLTIGDGDSSLPQNMDLLLPEEKNISDLGFALKNLPSIQHIEATGFVGGRLDHQLAVFGEFNRYLQEKGALVSLDSGTHGYLIGGSQTHCINREGAFSLFSLQKNRIKIDGDVKYKLKEFTEIDPLSSHGLSNSATGSIIIEAENPLLILPITFQV